MEIKELLSDSGQAVGYMIREITDICRKFGKRAPGSEGEREAAEYFARVLREECGCAQVKTERFSEHPDSFYGYFYLSAFFDVLCAVSFFFLPVLSVLTGCAAILLFLLHFVLYRKILDPLSPKKESVNVTAVRPCAGQVRQRVFLNGHLDAAWEFTLNYHFGGIVFEIPGVAATVGVFFYVFLSAAALCGAGGWVRTAGLTGLVFVPFFLLLVITYNPKRIVDGANDNLSGCLIGVALLREMERNGIIPEHTEVGVILTGSEEAGLRGAKAWCEAHREDCRDVPTYIVCFDTIHDPDCLMVNRRDLNSTVRSDRALCEAFLDTAKEAGVFCGKGRVPLFGGATDSAAFTQGGFRSIGVTGLSHVLEDYYHTRRDSYDNLNPQGLGNCYRATAALIAHLDREIRKEFRD